MEKQNKTRKICRWKFKMGTKFFRGSGKRTGWLLRNFLPLLLWNYQIPKYVNCIWKPTWRNRQGQRNQLDSSLNLESPEWLRKLRRDGPGGPSGVGLASLCFPPVVMLRIAGAGSMVKGRPTCIPFWHSHLTPPWPREGRAICVALRLRSLRTLETSGP